MGTTVHGDNFVPTMNHCDSNTSIETLAQHSEKESPPFALEENILSTSTPNYNHDSLKKLSTDDKYTSNSVASVIKNENREQVLSKLHAIHSHHSHSMMANSAYSLPSVAPDLMESAMTDRTSCSSTTTASNSEIESSVEHETKNTSSPFLKGSFQISSMLSTASLKSIPMGLNETPPSNSLPNSGCSPFNHERVGNIFQPSSDQSTSVLQFDESLNSIGYSELMSAADDSNLQLGQSTHFSQRKANMLLSPLIENQALESGALISPAPQHVDDSRVQQDRSWWQNVPLLGSKQYTNTTSQELDTPLLPDRIHDSNSVGHSQMHITRLLSQSSIQTRHAHSALDRAVARVQTNIESEDSFQVCMVLEENSRYTVDDVMEIISSADLLSLWCDPIESLIVTSNSSGNNSSTMSMDDNTQFNGEAERGHLSDEHTRPREYEGEWIEATTSALVSPSGFILSIFQSVLENLGCASYGRITMFIERRRGHIGLTVGPFHGGIHASHSINVEMLGGRIKIVDRVRLTRDNDGESYFSMSYLFGCTPCLTHCLFPSVVGYMDQVTTSLARLRVLLENYEHTEPPNHRPYV